MRNLFPTATYLEPKNSSAAVREVFGPAGRLGIIVRSAELVPVPGYGGKPINILVGIDTSGQFVGLRALDHREPLFLQGKGILILQRYLDQFVGASIGQRMVSSEHEQEGTEIHLLDGITSASITTTAINRTVMRASRQASRAKNIGTEGSSRQPTPWNGGELARSTLIRDGLILDWPIYRADIEHARQSGRRGMPSESLKIQDETPLSHLQIYYLNHPRTQHAKTLKISPAMRAAMQAGERVFAIRAVDDSTPWARSQSLHLSQNGVAVELIRRDAASEGSAVRTAWWSARAIGFDPETMHQWQLRMADDTALRLRHRLPSALYQPLSESLAEPLWLEIWRTRWREILGEILLLAAVIWAFLDQKRLSKAPGYLPLVRYSLLLITVVFLGYTAQGQLSVINILTLLGALRDGFSLQPFLLDPVIFILWSVVFVSLFLFGRGLYCGYLCPFGALQEAVSKLAYRLNIRQWPIEQKTHQKLQLLKYPLLGGLSLVYLYDASLTTKLAEVEPFKTSITLYFDREWYYVAWALLLIGLSAYVHKAWCRYLCPLGAGLALVGRYPLFNWLQRRNECGKPCQLCRHACHIGAIDRSGTIDLSECVQCLECVAILRDPTRCAVERAAKRHPTVPTNRAVIPIILKP